MFKTFYLLAGGADPFAATGDDAAGRLAELAPNATGYVQTRAIGESAFAGCAEIYFRYAKEAVAAESLDLSTLLGDGSEPAAVISGMLRVVMRVPEFSGTQKMKGVYPFKRKPGMSVNDFQQHWWHVHGPIAALTDEALGYNQTHPLPGSYDSGTPDFDGVTEIYWHDMEAASRAVISRQMVEDQRNDAENFVDLENVTLFFGAEEIVVAP